MDIFDIALAIGGVRGYSSVQKEVGTSDQSAPGGTRFEAGGAGRRDRRSPVPDQRMGNRPPGDEDRADDGYRQRP